MMKWTLAVLLFGLLAAAFAHGRGSRPHRPHGHGSYGHGHGSLFNSFLPNWLQTLLYGMTPTTTTTTPTTTTTTTTPVPISVQCFNETLQRIGEDNDHDNYRYVNGTDVTNDVSNNYDANKDGVWSDTECLNRYSCRYGSNFSVTTYICALLLQGESGFLISRFNAIPTFVGEGQPLDEFLNINADRYQLFSDNQCVNKCLSRDEKLTLNAANNDYDGDGNVTLANIRQDLTSNYDANGDGFVTRDEWVTRWVCAYGDSAAYARFLYDAAVAGASNITISTFGSGAPSTAIPVETWKTAVNQTYATYVSIVNPNYENECQKFNDRLKTCYNATSPRCSL